MKRTTGVLVVAVALTIGMASLTTSAAAQTNPDPDTDGGLTFEEAERCSETVTVNGEDHEVSYPCNAAEVEWCTTAVEDPMGMPQVVPYPCGATVYTPTQQAAEPEVICWGVTEDPWGMPQLYPYPCAIGEPL